MSGILGLIKEKIFSGSSNDDAQDNDHIDDLISLGVLLWMVAEADDKFLPQEQEQIEEILRSHSRINEDDMPIVLRAIKEASLNSIDVYSFTSAVSKDLPYNSKVAIIENLFRVACGDKELDHEEHETIRKIANLFKIEHKDFIDAKIAIKKEFGIDGPC